MNSEQEKSERSGILKFHDLHNWWVSEWTEEERSYIESKYKPMGIGVTSNPLTRGRFVLSGESQFSVLASIAGYLTGVKNYYFGKKIIEKAEESLIKTKNPEILRVHFLYHTMIKICYSARNIDPDALNLAVKACEKQISIAPLALKEFKLKYPSHSVPWHTGYEQLCIILEKQGRLDDAIQLARKALSEGWGGNWSQRIDRCLKKQGSQQ